VLGTFWGGGGPPSRSGAGGAGLREAGGHGDGLDPFGEGDGRQELDHHDVVVLGGGIVVGVCHQLLHHLLHLAKLPRVEVVLAQADGGDPAAGGTDTWDTRRGGWDHETVAREWGLETTVWGVAWLGDVGHGQPGPCTGRRVMWPWVLGDVAWLGHVWDAGTATWPWHAGTWPGHAWDMAWPVNGTWRPW